MRKEDRIGISSLVFTPKGEAFYQCSSSELQRVSVAAAYHLELKSKLQWAPDVRYEIKDDNPLEIKFEDKVVLAEASPSLTASNKEKGNAESADTDSAVARQNRLNEKQVQSLKSLGAINVEEQNLLPAS